MASSSAALTPQGRPKKYDVFISFRGEDTRNNFTSHLHAALCRRGLKVYIDNKLDKGDEISSALITAIKESYTSLIIFSEDYASSKWCLDELTKIIECKKLEGQVVIPVFYKVDPSHVRKQLGSYKKAFVKHKRDRNLKDKVQEWKTVLTQTANLAGFHSSYYGTDCKLSEEIAKEVQKKVNHLYPNNEFNDLVGLDQNFPDLETLLAINANDVRIIGIWGMGGIGKTMLAKALFAKYSCQYEGSCFLNHVREESNKCRLNHLHSELLFELLREDNHEIRTPGFVLSSAKRRLSSKKVFIVLDDVNSSEQLEHLVEKHSLGLGSRVILTTRDKHVLSGGIDGYHEVKKLSFEDSLQLFSLNAFKESKPKMQYEELSARAVDYAKGVPLALKVLGSFLRSKTEEEWDSALRKLEKILNKDIQNVLRLSYDELDHTEKKIFLDIANFMKGWDEGHVKRILDACGFFADIGMRILVDKALITISNHRVEMHDLIQKMGWEIVHQESEDPEKRSRLWDSEEVYHVLRNNRGTDAIEGICLNAHKFGDLYLEPDVLNAHEFGDLYLEPDVFKKMIKDLYLEPDVFKKMIKLRFLIFDGYGSEKFNLYLPSNLESLPDSLRVLHWSKYPLKSLPSTFHPEKLVELRMPNSQVEKLWDGVQNLANLEAIFLPHSQNLLELPDLSRATNLKYMHLSHCISLRDVNPSIFSLPKLGQLWLTGCKALKSLKSNIHSTSPEILYAHGCSSLQEFSVISENMRMLDLSFTALDEFPLSSSHMEKLKLLSLRGCYQYDLSTLSIVLDSLRYLEDLDLSDCPLSELPDNISQLISLQVLSLNRSHLVRLPESIKHLSKLQTLQLADCEKLQSLPELPLSITFLNAANCTSLEILCGSTISAQTCIFRNCIKLRQHVLNTILSRISIKVTAIYSIPSSLCISFPGNKLPDWFNYRSTQPLLTVEIPSCSMIMCFAFCVIIPKVESDAMEDIEDYGCECCLEGKDGETTSNFISWCATPFSKLASPSELHSDHMYIWYDLFEWDYSEIMDAIKHNRISGNRKFSFTFLVRTRNENIAVMEPSEVSNEKQGVKYWYGVQPIYVSDDHSLIREGWSITCNRSRESSELESLPKITRKAIFPALSSGDWKCNESRGLKDILSLDC